jgi:hypothetical protein
MTSDTDEQQRMSNGGSSDGAPPAPERQPLGSGWSGRVGLARSRSCPRRRSAISSAIGGYMAYSEEARQWKVDMRREYEQEIRLEYGDDGYAD